MSRTLMAVCLVIMLTGCASRGVNDSNGSAPEIVGNASSATTWTGSISTRSPVSDNTEITTTATIGKPGVVPAANAGFCYVTNISGSFRGLAEYAYIDVNASGYYMSRIRSDTTYDSTNGVGPAMTMKCRTLGEFADAGAFSAAHRTASGAPPTGGTNYGQTTYSVSAGSMYPWAGLEGRLSDAGTATWMLSAMDHSTDTAFARWAKPCPGSSGFQCVLTAEAWEITSAYAWTYSVTGASATNTADVQLISASGQECYIDGIWGYWTGTSSAKVEVQGDNYWHLVTAKGAAALGMGAYASCFPLAQGF